MEKVGYTYIKIINLSQTFYHVITQNYVPFCPMKSSCLHAWETYTELVQWAQWSQPTHNILASTKNFLCRQAGKTLYAYWRCAHLQGSSFCSLSFYILGLKCSPFECMKRNNFWAFSRRTDDWRTDDRMIVWREINALKHVGWHFSHLPPLFVSGVATILCNMPQCPEFIGPIKFWNRLVILNWINIHHLHSWTVQLPELFTTVISFSTYLLFVKHVF